jgi:hypothetical protein
MDGCFVCQDRIDSINHLETLFKRFDDLISGQEVDLDKESWMDRRSRLAECRALTDHTRGMQRELASHTRVHGCGAVAPMWAAAKLANGRNRIS